MVKKRAVLVAADRTPDRRQTGPGKDFHSDATHTLGILSATEAVRDNARRAVTHVHLHRPETACLGCADKLDGLYEERCRGHEEGVAEGRRQAAEAIRAQAPATSVIEGGPDLMAWAADLAECPRCSAGVCSAHRPPGPWEPAEQPACPKCSGPVRETVGMVCQACGTDYASAERPETHQ